MSPMFRARVVRADGRAINVVQRRAHLSYCFTGCCCGRTERGYAAVPVDTFKDEWLRRKLRNVVHLTKAGCLGPCALANVASLVFDGRSVCISGFFRDAFPHLIALVDEAVERVAALDEDHAVAIVITDGRANVPTGSDDAWADAQAAAGALRCPALIVDTEDARTASGRPRVLAQAMGASYARLDALDASEVITLARGSS